MDDVDASDNGVRSLVFWWSHCVLPFLFLSLHWWWRNFVAFMFCSSRRNCLETIKFCLLRSLTPQFFVISSIFFCIEKSPCHVKCASNFCVQKRRRTPKADLEITANYRHYCYFFSIQILIIVFLWFRSCTSCCQYFLYFLSVVIVSTLTNRHCHLHSAITSENFICRGVSLGPNENIIQLWHLQL